MEYTFLNEHSRLPRGSLLPDALDTVPVSNTAKLAYVKLLRKIIICGEADENGIYFVQYPINDLAVDLGKSEMTVKRCLHDLEIAGLIMKVRSGIGKPTHIYVLVAKE